MKDQRRRETYAAEPRRAEDCGNVHVRRIGTLHSHRKERKGKVQEEDEKTTKKKKTKKTKKKEEEEEEAPTCCRRRIMVRQPGWSKSDWSPTGSGSGGRSALCEGREDRRVEIGAKGGRVTEVRMG